MNRRVAPTSSRLRKPTSERRPRGGIRYGLRPARLPPREQHCIEEEEDKPGIDLHLSTAGRHAVSIHPRVNIGSARWVRFRSAPTLFEVYDNLPHRELHESPREAFERLLAQYGDRPERRIAYNSDFLITTCPSTPKGTARVQPDGVKLTHKSVIKATLTESFARLVVA